MIVVSDTTAISNLLTLGLEDLLPALFACVIVPQAVKTELLAWHTSVPDWLEVCAVEDTAMVAQLRHTLDMGEAEAIALALELHPNWLLMDEAAGRQLAKARGLPVLGLLGILLLAKQQGQPAAVAPVLKRLREEAGFYCSRAVIEAVLRLAGETAC